MSENPLSLLKECLLNHRPDLVYVIDSEEQINIDSTLGNALRRTVCDEFISSGLQDDGEPNERGILLEELIDVIGRMFLYS